MTHSLFNVSLAFSQTTCNLAKCRALAYAAWPDAVVVIRKEYGNDEGEDLRVERPTERFSVDLKIAARDRERYWRDGVELALETLCDGEPGWAAKHQPKTRYFLFAFESRDVGYVVDADALNAAVVAHAAWAKNAHTNTSARNGRKWSSTVVFVKAVDVLEVTGGRVVRLADAPNGASDSHM